MNKRKILLIQPTIYDNNKSYLIKKKKLYFIGLTMPLLAALIPDNWDIEVCIETLEDVPFDTDAELIGIGSMGHSILRGIEIAQEFKKRGKTVVMGGYMASLVADEVKQYCDTVLIGDAEGCLETLLSDYEKGELKDFYRTDLGTLSTPIPKYELVTSKSIGDFLPVQAGRGCPNSCSFCSIACLYKTKYLRREIDEVMADIMRVKELGFEKFLLIDDNILSDKQYTRELCAEIKKTGMSWNSQCSIELAKDPDLLKTMIDSGCVCLSFGIESISRSNLIKINKSWCDPAEYGHLIHTLRNAGIDVATEMIVGLEDDTRESMRKTAEFIVENKIEFPKFYIMTPIPGTGFYDEIKESDSLVNKNIYEYSPTKAVLNSRYLTVKEIDEVYWELYNEVYSIKNIFKRVVFTKKALKYPKRVLFNLGVNLFYRYHIKQGIGPIII